MQLVRVSLVRLLKVMKYLWVAIKQVYRKNQITCRPGNARCDGEEIFKGGDDSAPYVYFNRMDHIQ